MNSIPAPRPVSLAAPQAKGMDFVRAAIALAAAGGKAGGAETLAAARWGDDSRAARYLKAAVTSDDLNGDAVAAAVEFMAAVRERSVVGKLTGLRRRPIQTRYLVNTGPATGYWTGEGQAIPVLPLTFEQATLSLLKVASIAVFTDETLRSVDPGVEAGIRQDMVDGLAEAIDAAFLDPANAGTAGETPASVTNGLTPVSVGTSDADDVRAALSTMIEEFQGNLSKAVFIGRPELFAFMHSQGYDKVGIRGGELVGAPAIATKGLPNAGGMYQLVLIDPSGVAYADDGSRASVTTSKNAAIQLSETPTNDAVTPTPTNLISLFQVNATALRAMAYANWEVEQTGAVSLMLAFPEAAAS